MRPLAIASANRVKLVATDGQSIADIADLDLPAARLFLISLTTAVAAAVAVDGYMARRTHLASTLPSPEE